MLFRSEKYNVNLDVTQSDAILKFCNDDVGITGEDLTRVKDEIRDLMLDNYQQGSAFLNQPLAYFGFDISDMTPDYSMVEAFGQLRGEQYLNILDIMNQGIILKSKKSYLKKRSSIMSEGKISHE